MLAAVVQQEQERHRHRGRQVTSGQWPWDAMGICRIQGEGGKLL